MPTLVDYLSRNIPDDKKLRIERQWREVMHNPPVVITCGCGQRRAVQVAYRCFHCGEWYCGDCSLVHFGTNEINDKYQELLFAVERKHPNEDRHATALRYIRASQNFSTVAVTDAS